MSVSARPPRFARALLARALPADVRDGILGDLEEVFQRDCRTYGQAKARLNYWRKSASFTAHFMAERFRGKRTMAMGMSWLDFKLGFRMLTRYPGLTLVGGLAIAFAIAVGASILQFMTLVAYPNLPLPEGDRIVKLRVWDTESNRAVQQASFDLATWRRDARSLEDLGAFRTYSRNLILPDGAGGPIAVAEISASAFRVTRVQPLMGRALTEADEQPGAPAVVVIGYGVWQSKFAGDSGAIGRDVRVGSVTSTVVGIMPDGYEFPFAHDAWVPMRLDFASIAPRQGPEFTVVGRLAPGVTMDGALAELISVSRRMSADFPDTHAHLRPQIIPYAKSRDILSSGPERVAFMSGIVTFVGLLVLLVCSNVALLMFARAATRESELIVRTALGASRRRITMQLFAEALVLSGVAALLGLGAASGLLNAALQIIEMEMLDGSRLPFWFQRGLSTTTVMFAIGLALLCAVITGVGPARKVMRGLGTRLRETTAGGGGLRFGGIWTAVIVTQVAVTVTFPAVSFYVWRDGAQIRAVDVGFPAEEYLSATIEMDNEAVPGVSASPSAAERRTRFRTLYQELERQLIAEPAVSGVTVASVLPRMYHQSRYVEVDEGGAAARNPKYPGYRVGGASIDPDFFEVFGTPMLAGRDFQASDVQSGGHVAIVNQSFVRLVLGGRNPIGRRLRDLGYADGQASSPNPAPGPWREIVGVVRDMGVAVEPDPKIAGFYVPLTPGQTYPVNMAVHVKGDAQAFASRLRAIAITVDPALRINQVSRLDRVADGDLAFIGFWFRLSVAVSVLALVLSLAGIYSVMSFTVSRRTREIGIRIALGARPQRVIAAILRRPLTQIGIGIAAGGLLVTGLNLPIYNGVLSPGQIALTIGYALLMAAVCLLACVVPVRRALRVEPTEALRADG